MKTAAIILAAGQSTRMNSDLPKVLHEVCGRPMLFYVLDACRRAGISPIYVVVGHRHELVRAAFADDRDLVWIHQTERKGTGHAVLCCEAAMADIDGNVVVIAGDMPLVRTATVEALLTEHQRTGQAVTLATAVLPDSMAYGRIIRDSSGKLIRIVEERDCTPEQLAIREVNLSYYCFEKSALFEALHKIKPNPLKGEYYLTDAVHIMVSAGQAAGAISAVPPEDAIGINSREELALVGRMMQQRIQRQWMAAGVTLVDPATTWINHGATIGRDTVIQPFTFIDGGSVVGRECRIGPFACLTRGDRLGDGESIGGLSTVERVADRGTSRSGSATRRAPEGAVNR
ncbi:MAG TPA: NTP transferase domain-containing protein [Phycisphaerae bacterium]